MINFLDSVGPEYESVVNNSTSVLPVFVIIGLLVVLAIVVTIIVIKNNKKRK